MGKSIFLILSTLLVGCATTPRYVVLNKQQSMFCNSEEIKELNYLACLAIGRGTERKELDSIYIYHVRICTTPLSWADDSIISHYKFVDEDFDKAIFFKYLSPSSWVYNGFWGLGKEKRYPYTHTFVFDKNKRYAGFVSAQWFKGRSWAKQIVPPAALIKELENDSLTGLFALGIYGISNGNRNTIFATTRNGDIKVFSYNDSITLEKLTLKEFGEKYIMKK